MISFKVILNDRVFKTWISSPRSPSGFTSLKHPTSNQKPK